MANYPYPVPEGVTITWEQEVRDDRQDACWYMESDALATVTYNDRTVYVDRNGALCVYDDSNIIKDTEGWINVGIRNDNDLWDRDDTLEWSMNPWFDSYEKKSDGDVDHLDFVEHSAYDAVSRAVEYIVGEVDNA